MHISVKTGTFGFALVFFLASAVSAQPLQDDYTTTIEGGRGLMYMQSARTYGKAKLVLGFKGLVMEKQSPVIDVITGKHRTRTDFPSVLSMPLSYGLTDEIDLNVSGFGFRDVRTLVSPQNLLLGYGEPMQGVGSIRVGVKIRLPLRESSPIQIAGKFDAMLDISEDEAEGMNYRWTKLGTDIGASLYQTVDLFPFLNLTMEEGYVLSGSKLYDDQIVGGLGLQLRIRNRCNINLELNNRTFLGVGPQSAWQALDTPDRFAPVNGVPAVGNTALLKDESTDFKKDFYIFSPSLDIRLTKNIAFSIGVNYNIADQVKPKETFQAVAGLTFNRVFTSLLDSDGDGVMDNVDMELHTPRGYPVDKRGVALDTDLDGVANGIDREPNTPLGAKTNAVGVGLDSDNDGVYDGIDMEPDTPEGSPVNRFGVALDDDHDGVSNLLDREPNTPVGAIVDSSGRAIDSDGDSIPDGIDLEPQSPKSALVDAFGVSIDSDQDGVPDGIDEELNTPQGTLVDKRGRGLVNPLVKPGGDILRDGLLRITTIQFGAGSATINPESYPSLDEIGQLLVKYDTLQIQIEGHTDNTGDKENNLMLSRERALAVRNYLLERFPQLSPSRLRAVGFGPDKPIAPNSTFDGRQANRRVEFVIINRE